MWIFLDGQIVFPVQLNSFNKPRLTTELSQIFSFRRTVVPNFLYLSTTVTSLRNWDLNSYNR